MKTLFKYISIVFLSIIYLLGSGVFFHTMAMEDDMQMPMECCESYDTSPKSIDSQQSSHCLGYEDAKLTDTSYSNHKTSNSITLHYKPLDIISNNRLSENNSTYRFLPKDIHTPHNQNFLQFSDLVGIIILLC